MKICAQCGSEVAFRFCETCGFDTDKPTQNTVVSEPEINLEETLTDDGFDFDLNIDDDLILEDNTSSDLEYNVEDAPSNSEEEFLFDIEKAPVFTSETAIHSDEELVLKSENDFRNPTSTKMADEERYENQYKDLKEKENKPKKTSYQKRRRGNSKKEDKKVKDIVNPEPDYDGYYEDVKPVDWRRRYEKPGILKFVLLFVVGFILFSTVVWAYLRFFIGGF